MSNQDLELLSTEEVAKILKVGPRTVVAYILDGDLPAVSLRRGYRVYRKDLDKFLADRYKRPEKKQE